MSKRAIAELLLWVVSQVSKIWITPPKKKPASILVLRNNGLGDLLCVTPLFEMLRKKFPDAKIYAGIGSWHENLLQNNPYLTQCVQVNGPWHNQFSDDSSVFSILKYIFFSPEVRALRKLKFDSALDIVGSIWGSLLFLRLAIPQRLGVNGYDGGHSSNQLSLVYDPKKHVAQSALDMGRLLQIDELPEPRPQIFISKEEVCQADRLWSRNSRNRRIVLAPGGSFDEKCWGKENFQEILEMILTRTDSQVLIIGGKKDRGMIELEDITPQCRDRTRELTGTLNLRESAALIATSDIVVCNSSMPMHLAGAFRKPCLTLLGNWYESSKLHHLQWGYPESIVLGKEVKEGKVMITSVDEAFNRFEKLR